MQCVIQEGVSYIITIMYAITLENHVLSYEQVIRFIARFNQIYCSQIQILVIHV